MTAVVGNAAVVSVSLVFEDGVGRGSTAITSLRSGGSIYT